MTDDKNANCEYISVKFSFILNTTSILLCMAIDTNEKCLKPLLPDNLCIAINLFKFYTAIHMFQPQWAHDAFFWIQYCVVEGKVFLLYGHFLFGNYNTKLVRFCRFNFVYGTNNAFNIFRKFSNITELWCLVK